MLQITSFNLVHCHSCEHGRAETQAACHGSKGFCSVLSTSSWAEAFAAMCRDLFQRPCSATGQLLAMDMSTQQLLPPIVRPYAVAPEELELIAGGSMEAAAYHVHASLPGCKPA